MGGALAGFGDGGVEAADVAQVLFVADGIFADAEGFGEDALVEDADVQIVERVARLQGEELGADGGADDGAGAGLGPAALEGVEGIQRSHLEIDGGGAQKGAGEGFGGDAVDQAVGGEDFEAGRVHVDEGHHDAIGAGEVWVLMAEGQGGFIAMVAIGDEQLLIAHEGLDGDGVGRCTRGDGWRRTRR